MMAFNQLRNIVFVNICDFGDNQITFHDQFMKNTRKPSAILSSQLSHTLCVSVGYCNKDN